MSRPNSQQVKSMKTKMVSQQVEDDATPRLVGSVSFGISPNVTPGGDHVAGLDAEHVEEKINDLMRVKEQRGIHKRGL